jgi:hypothetical protein
MINPDPKMIAQLNLLSDLIGNSSSGDSSRSGLVKLSLFDDDEDDTSPPLVLFLFKYFYISLFIRIQKRPQASSTNNQRPRNEDITIDASKVSFSIRVTRT